MAITLKSRTEMIELSDEFNGLNIRYHFQLKDNILKDNVTAVAVTADGRQIMYCSSSDGENYYANTNLLPEDDVTGLHDILCEKLQAIISDPVGFLSAVPE